MLTYAAKAEIHGINVAGVSKSKRARNDDASVMLSLAALFAVKCDIARKLVPAVTS